MLQCFYSVVLYATCLVFEIQMMMMMMIMMMTMTTIMFAIKIKVILHVFVDTTCCD